MASTYDPTIILLSDPDLMFTEDLIDMADPIPEMNARPGYTPTLKIYARGEGPAIHGGQPDFTTDRTDVYIIGWREDMIVED